MMIEFQHQNYKASAFINYNLDQVLNSFFIIPVNYKKELGVKIFFYKNGNNWESDSLLSKNFPNTFKNIINEFEKISLNYTHAKTHSKTGG
jgi:hypothetical protein